MGLTDCLPVSLRRVTLVEGARAVVEYLRHGRVTTPQYFTVRAERNGCMKLTEI